MSFDTDPNEEITISASDLAQLKGERDALAEALQDLREAFVVAVGDKSPFAKIAIGKADAALAAAGAPQ